MLIMVIAGLSFSADVTSCSVINDTGSHVLTTDLAGAPINASPLNSYTTCIKIASPDVYLDCDGHSITGDGSSFTFGILVNGSIDNISILNCPSISNYSEGIRIFNSTLINVSNTTTHNNSVYGIFLDRAKFSDMYDNVAYGNDLSGFIVSGGWNNSVYDNYAYENGLGFGFITTENNTVTFNNATDNDDDGFGCAFAFNSVYSGNNASTNGLNGYNLIFCNDNDLTSNSAFQNTENGFLLDTSDGNAFSLNNADRNILSGINIDDSDYNTFLLDSVMLSGQYGIHAMDSVGLQFTNLSVYDNLLHGMFLDGVNDSLLTSNLVFRNNMSGAVLLGDRNSFNLGEFYENDYEGIYVASGNDNNISGASAHDNGLCGIVVGSTLFPVNNTRVDSNLAYGNTHGLCYNGAGYVYSTANTVYGNTLIGLSLTGYASHITTAFNTLAWITDDHFYDNLVDLEALSQGTGFDPLYIDMDGVVFDSASGAYNDFTNITMEDIVELSTGYAMDWNAPITVPPGTLPFENKFLNISQTNDTWIDDISWTWEDGELSGYNESSFELWKYNASGWTLLNDSPDTGANTLSLTNHTPASVYAIVQNANCPAPITSSGTYGLTGPVTGAPNAITSFTDGLACIRIAASDVLFDCNGYGVINNGTGYGTNMTVGIIADGDYNNITIQNCPSVTEYTYGVGLDHADDSVIRNVTAHHNGHAGIYIARGGDRNNITNSTAHSHPVLGLYPSQHAYDGFYIHSGSDNRLWDNVAWNNTYGFDVRVGVSGNNLSDNNAYFNTHGIYVSSNTNQNHMEYNYAHDNDYGITLSSSSNESLFNNTVEDNQVHGFWLLNSVQNDLYNNTAYDSQSNGYHLENADDNYLEDNFALGNGHAFMLTGGSDDNELRENNASGNNADGFRLDNAERNLLVGNTAEFNTDRGFYLGTSLTRDNTLQLNWAHDNLHGLNLVNTQFNNMTANEFYNNSGSGAILLNSHDNLFTGNDAYGNNAYGYSILSGSYNNIFAAEDSFSNDIDGFYVRESHNNTFLLCDVYSNNDEGFEVQNGSDNNFTLNNLWENNAGFYLHTDSDSNHLEGNEVYNSTNEGYHLHNGANSNTLLDNLADGNSEGFYIVETALNNLIDNEAYNNDYGIYLVESNDTTMQGNIFADSPNWGAYIYDSDNTMFGSDHFFRNGMDMTVESAFSWSFILNLSTVIFDSPLGNLTNFTNISLNDDVENDGSYSLYWTNRTNGVPPTATRDFEGKFLNLTREFGAIDIDSMTWHWRDDESAPYIENLLFLWRYNNSMWGIVDSSPDTALNTLSVTGVTEPSTTAFGIFEFRGSTGDDGGGGSDKESLTIELDSECEGNIVTVSDGGEVEGASVSVFNADTLQPIATNTTDSDGEFMFEGCGIDVRIHANHEDYSGNTVIKPLIDCSLCVLECEEDIDCVHEEMCLLNACVPIDCPCGEIVDHACSAYECCSDSHCGEGLVCHDNSCIPEEEEPPCAFDSDCDMDESCDAGNCTVITGSCGYIEDHEWVSHECGPDPECPECAPGVICQDHMCVETVVECPESGVVGTPQSCIAETGLEPCADCDYVITDPSGKQYKGKTGADGSIALALNMEGLHKVAIIKDGAVVSEVEVEAKPKGPVGDEDKPSAQEDLLPVFAFLIVILAVLALLVFYWRKSKGTKK
jgi:parallel beta-helix repeat protein